MVYIDKAQSDDSASAKNSHALSAADFEIYAPKALATADIDGNGVVTKSELAHMIAAPAAGAEAKTVDTMRFLNDHYDFMQKLSTPRSVLTGTSSDLQMIGNLATRTQSRTYRTEYGITGDAITKMTDVLDGKAQPGLDQVTSHAKDNLVAWGLLGDTAGSVAGGIAAVGLHGVLGLGTASALVEVGAVIGCIAGGGAIVAAAAAYGAYSYYKHYERKAYQNETRSQYSSFLQDLSGTEAVRQRFRSNVF